MIIYLLRHAIAVPRGSKDYPNDDRPLTPKGRKRMLRNAAGIRSLDLRVDAVMTSPLRRAAETADIVRNVLEFKKKATATDLLLPDHEPGGILAELKNLTEIRSVMLVGHEPQLGNLASTLLDAPLEAIMLKKGGLCRIDVDEPDKQNGRMIWHLTPKQLRLLARS